MAKKAKILILISFVAAFLILISSSSSNYIPLQFTNQTNGMNNINALNYKKENYTSAYEGNLSLLYTWWESYTYSWSSENQSTHLIPNEDIVNNYTYSLNYIDIYAFDLFNGTDSYTIADNLTAETNMTPSISFAQEFVAPDLILIENISVFLNYSLPSSEPYRFEVSIFDETFQRRLGYSEAWDDRQNVTEWYLFQFYKNILKPGEKYNIALTIWFNSSSNYGLTDFWKAETHDESSDKGITRIYNGTWNQIENDTTLDLLCILDYYIMIDPAKIDLKFIIEDQIINPIYRQSVYFTGYEAYLTYNLESPPDHDINVTIVANQTLDTLSLELDARYIYLIPINGTCTTSENQIEWEIKYLYKDVSGTRGQSWDFFLFERDWNLIHFYDPSYHEFEDLFIGAIKVWNVTYNGICNIYVAAFEQDIHTAICHSPNYCAGISTKVKDNNNSYQVVASFALGQVVRIETSIKDSSNNLISGGKGLIELISPSGRAIYNNTALTSINGILNSSDLFLDYNLEEGTYTINIFWTNGKEVAFSSTIIEIKRTIIPIIPQSNALPLVILILIGFLIAAAIATPAAFVIRRQLQQRNWEKSCRNLFVFAKSGVSVYFHTFGIEIQDPTLISAMITALTSFIQEATGSKKLLRTIDQEDKKILLFHGDYTIHALIAEKNLPIIRKNLEKFGRDFEKTFQSKLMNWDGNVGIFKGTEKIIDKYFPVEMEEKIIRGVRLKLTEFLERITSITDPVDVISIFREITEFTTRYQAIINKHYSKEYNELIKIAEEKLHN